MSEYLQSEIELPAQPAPRVVKAGDQVLYVLDQGRSAGQVRPAFVVRAWNDVYVNLMVLTDCTNDFDSGQSGANGTYWATSVTYDKAATKPRTWLWPEDAK
jgi:hypothetical protein